MDFSPESTGDGIHSDENSGQNSNRGIVEINPAEFVGSMLEATNETIGIDVKLTVFP